MILTDQLSEFIDTFNNAVIQDMEFDVWVHKVFDKTFNDWQNQVHSGNVEAQNVKMTDDEIKTTVKRSLEILGNFTPDGGE